jgi:CheY-like chemotaxis protein
MVEGDCGCIRQILSNLINNAIKFTAQGEVSLSVMQIENDESSSLLFFEIRDTGPGIAPEAQERVFERFSQADGALNRSFGGTGLGLTISRQLVELMGGTIGLKSESGKGSTFWFSVRLPKSTSEAALDDHAESCSASLQNMVPLLPASDKPDTVTVGFEQVSQTSRASFVPELRRITENHVPHILVVEDNAANQNLIITILHRLNYQVDSAFNGEEAVEAWSRGNYDLLLMDGQMPVMDGIEATRIIREREAAESRPRTIIVALTGQAIKGDREQFLAVGMDDYLAKPFTLAQIRSVMNAWLPAVSRPEESGQTEKPL